MTEELFAQRIIHFYLENKRDLPWRRTSDPYLIWLSEVILQQTQVIQGLSYYEKFSHTFKTVEELASADEQDVLNLWQGLGYYSRARNLHSAAKHIKCELNGIFPTTYSELLKLKGVGHYTAAAVASFSYKEHVAVLDGNVFRVLSRVFGITEAINSPSGVRTFKSLSQQLLPEKDSDVYNQGIMEFGALQCTPKSPNCEVCTLKDHCHAYNTGTIADLPLKIKKTRVKPLFIHFFVITSNGEVFLRKRTENGIWKNLWEFPNATSSVEIDVKDAINTLLKGKTAISIKLVKSSASFKHILSHRKIMAIFHDIDIEPSAPLEPEWTKLPIHKMDSVPIHRLMEKFLESDDNFLY